MKKYLAVFTAISLISTISAFEDKPALSRAEQGFLFAAKPIGIGAGVLTGAVAGGVAAENIAPKDPYMLGALMVAGPLVPVGAGLGGYVGAKYTRAMALWLLARWHGVSKRVEEVSQYYNINTGQYRPILIAAEVKDSNLLQEIDSLFVLRFGENWKELLNELFKKYKREATVLKKGSFKLDGSKKTFVRMVELGAAMADLYFKTDPKLGNEFRSAKRMYKKLGLLK